MASQALEINPGNQLAPYVIGALENPPYNYTPPPEEEAAPTPEEPEEQAAESEAAPVEEEQAQSVDQAVDEKDNTLIYALVAGLVVAFGAILLLVYKLGKKSAS